MIRFPPTHMLCKITKCGCIAESIEEELDLTGKPTKQSRAIVAGWKRDGFKSKRIEILKWRETPRGCKIAHKTTEECPQTSKPLFDLF